MNVGFWLGITAVASASALVLYYILTNRRKYRPYYLQKAPRTDLREPADKSFSVYLIGDAGAPNLNGQDPVLTLLKSKLDKESSRSAVFFLGDNVYPHGIPPATAPDHHIAEERLTRQLEAIKDFAGKKVMISGNHDWNKGREGGLEFVLRQQTFVDAFFHSENIYLPRNGCPGPVEINLNEYLTAVVINSQWWVQNGVRPEGKKDGCEAVSEHDFFLLLNKALLRNRGKHILVIAHHPLYSNSFHGGHFHLKQHLFPLTALNKKMYVPVPGLGSIYPIFRKYIGSKEDMAHPRYKNYRTRLLKMIRLYPNLVYAAGHDHNLQYIRKGKQHYLVSGAGSKTAYVKKGGTGVGFTHAHKGFMKIEYRKNAAWLEIWEPADSEKGILAFSTRLF